MELVDLLSERIPATQRLESPALQKAVLQTWAASLTRSPCPSLEASPQAPHMPDRSLRKHVNEVNALAIDLSEIAHREYGLEHDFDFAPATAILHADDKTMIMLGDILDQRRSVPSAIS
jgi:hypothetical protein